MIAWNFFEPPPVKSIWTIHWPVCWLMVALASSTSLPPTSAGPRMYFSHTPSFSPQASVGSLGFAESPRAPLAFSFVQSSATKSAWSFSVAGSAGGAALSLGAGLSEGPGLSEAPGVGVASAFRLSVRARPWVVSEALGAPAAGGSAGLSPGLSLVEGLGFGLSLEPALGVASGCGCCADGSPGPRVRTGRKYS